MSDDQQSVIRQVRQMLQDDLAGGHFALSRAEQLAALAMAGGLGISEVAELFQEVLLVAPAVAQDQTQLAALFDVFAETVKRLTAAEQARSEARLRTSEEQFRVIFQESLDVIIIIDGKRGTILGANRATPRILGYTETELIGRHFSTLMPAFVVEEQEFLENLEIYGSVFEAQEFLRADGSRCPVDLTAIVIPWGETEAVMLTLRDVTERQQVEQEIEQRNHELLTLQLVGATLATHLDLSYVLNTIAQEVTELLRAETCFISEWNKSTDTIIPLAYYSLAEKPTPPVVAQPLAVSDHPEMATVLQKGESRHFKASQLDPASVEWVYMQQHNLKNLLMFPLQFQSRVLGLIQVEDSGYERTISQADLGLTQSLANYAAAAVQTTYLRSEMERYNRQLLVLHELDRVISNSLDLQDVYGSIAQHASRLLSYDLMTVTLRDEDELRIAYLYPENSGRLNEEIKLTFETSLLNQVIKQGEPRLVENLAEDRQVAADAGLLDGGLQSVMIIPLWLEDDVIGTWNIASRASRAYDEYDINIAQSIADQLAVAIRHAQIYQQAQQEIVERKQTEAILRSNQELFRQVVSSISDHIYVTEVSEDGQLNNIYMSPNVEDLTGYPLEQLLNAWSFWPSVLIHPEDRFIAKEQADRLIAGQSSEAQYRLIRADGQTIWVRDSGRVHSEADTRIIYGVVGDITEQKQHERELEAIATIATALRSALTHTEMLSLILDPILELLQIDGATLNVYHPATEELVVELARGEWANLIGLRMPAAKGVANYVLTTGNTYVSNDVRGDGMLYYPEATGPLKAVACVPLLAQTQIVGVLWVGRTDEMTADTVRPLLAISDIAANALHRASLFEQLQSSNAELMRLTADLENLVKQRTAALEQALTQASEARDKIDAILQSIADGVIVTDLENKVVLVNPAAEQILGFKLEAMLGQEIGTGIKDDRLRQIVRGTLNQYINGYEIDIELEDPRDGRQRTMRAHTSLVDERQGRPLGTVTIIQDVTAMREVDRMKTEFLTTAAHEFRTPLTSVLGFSEILLTRDLDEARRKRYLQMINQKATDLAGIVKDLLDVARLEAGRGMEIKAESIDIVPLITDTLLSFSETQEQHQFDSSNLGDLPAVQADRSRLVQVIENLISNAIKYSPDGGIVTVFGRVVGDFVEIGVRDTGIGMTADQQEHLFEKFYRADTSNTTISGTGLGLTICKLIVELHRGKIWVESEPGQGSTVYFTIPIADRERRKSRLSVPSPKV